MIEAVIRGLISLCLIAAAGVLVIWVLGILGIHLPGQIITIFYVILGLIAVLILVRILRPHAGSWLP